VCPVSRILYQNEVNFLQPLDHKTFLASWHS